MRNTLLVPCILLVAGCAKEAKVETAPPAPAALVAADAAGTLEGTTMAEANDSVLSTWTAHQVADGAGGLSGKFVSHANMKDTVAYTTTLSGDSAVSVSGAYTDPAMPKGTPPLKWRAVGHANGHEWSGTVTIMVAANDSVVQRAKWKATHTP
jgi:hypothetical protein